MRGRGPVLALLLAVTLLTLPPGAYAAGPVDTDADCALTVHYLIDSVPMNGVAFSVYRVADVAADGSYTLTADAETAGLDLSGTDEEVWTAVTALAATLAGTEPDATATTGTDGTAAFTVKPGLYVVTGATCLYDGKDYTPIPALAVLPYNYHGSWSYIETREVKATYVTALRTLTVLETVTGNMGSKAENFSFTAIFLTAEGGDPIGAGTYGGVTVAADGTGAFTLRHGESLEIAGLPANTHYTITQTAPGGYAVRTVVDSAEENDAIRSGTLRNDTTVEFVSDRTVGLATGSDRQMVTVRILAGVMLISGLSGFIIILLLRRRKGDRT